MSYVIIYSSSWHGMTIWMQLHWRGTYAFQFKKDTKGAQNIRKLTRAFFRMFPLYILQKKESHAGWKGREGGLMMTECLRLSILALQTEITLELVLTELSKVLNILCGTQYRVYALWLSLRNTGHDGFDDVCNFQRSWNRYWFVSQSDALKFKTWARNRL